MAISDYSNLTQIMSRIHAFNEARDWRQFHNPKDMAISLSLEANEVLEHFQWKNPEEVNEHIKSHKDDIASELADVAYWVLYMSDLLDIDIAESMDKKMTANEAKYPADKARGKHQKYTAYKQDQS